MRHVAHPVKTIVAAGMVLLTCAPVWAQCVRQSPAHRVALIELFTSEGCDSCPPADQWLSRVGPLHSPYSAVPLSLHVTYWDHLGWKDRLADVRLTERQNELTRLAKAHVVYTPGVFLNLREFRRWANAAEFQKAIGDVNAAPARAAIRIVLALPGEGLLSVRTRFELKPNAAPSRPQAYVALYESALQTAVQGGENRGVTLRHDYVVRQLLGPIEFKAGVAEFDKAIALQPQWRPGHMGVAAFVQDAGTLDVLQATALKLCP